MSCEYASQAVFQTLQTKQMNFEKMLGQQVFKIHFCFYLQVCPSVPPLVFCCVIYTFYSYPEQLFHVSLSLVAVPI